MSGSTSIAIATSARSAGTTFLFPQPLAHLLWKPSGQVLSLLTASVGPGEVYSPVPSGISMPWMLFLDLQLWPTPFL